MTIGLAPQNEALRVEAAPLAMFGPGVVILGTKYCWRQGLSAAGAGLAVLATCPASAARHRTSRCGRWIPCKIYVGYSYCCNFFPRVSWCILSGPFLLEHPAIALRELIMESQIQSVFTDIGKINFRDPANYYLIPSVPGLASNSVASAAWLSSEGEALFALPSAAGGIFVIKLPPHDLPGTVSVVELKQSSVVQRFLTGWMPTAIRGDCGPSDLPISLSVHCLDHDAFLFALCQDHKLRMWSYKDQMCLMVADLLEFMPVSRDLRLAAGTGHRLRLAFSQSLGLYLGVYMHAPKRGQVWSNGKVNLLGSADGFWRCSVGVLQCKADPVFVILRNVAGQWNQVFVQPLPEEEVTVRHDQDPRETYLEYLFMPGRFTNAAIQKALQIFSQGTERHMDLTWDELKKEVTLAVENEFQGSVTEYECSPEEFWQLQVEFWSKFYACCLQYQEALSRPLALHLNPYTSMVCLLKKGSLSFLVPCSLVDHLYLLSNEHLLMEDDAAILDDLEMSRDVVCLVQCLRLIGESISMEMAFIMEMACSRLQPPEKAAEQILEDLIANDTDNVMEDIHSKLQEIRNPIHAIGVLIREMDYETDADMERAHPLNMRMNLTQLYGSGMAVSVVCWGVCKIATIRFLICRDLLILQQLLLRLGDPMVLGGGQLFQSQQDLLHRTSPLLLSYYLIRWASQCLASDVPVDTLESNLQHLSVLELADTTALTTHKLVSSPQTIVELFFREVARKHIVSRLFLQPNTSLAETSLNWPHLITAIVADFLPLLWPSNPGFLFPECLMGSCQYTQLQEYIRLLQPWCHVNMGSCCFMMGRCYLVMGEGHKVRRSFCACWTWLACRSWSSSWLPWLSWSRQMTGEARYGLLLWHRDVSSESLHGNFFLVFIT
uniref:Nucleoporin 160 n=1 Tax=Anser cygnoides TaxID=8845 RepID=A0A8B9EMS6_ANSCY